MAFTPINTQEEFDAAIADRLSRDRAKYSKQFEAEMKEKGWKTTEEVAGLTKELTDKVTALTAQLQTQTETINGHKAEVDTLNAKIHDYETASVKTAVALELGLPYQMASRLSGDNEADIRKDAEAMVKLIGGQNKPAPLPGGGSPKTATSEMFANAVSDFFNHS